MQRIDVLSMAEKSGSMNGYRGMLNDCLNDYDDRRWKNDWVIKEQKEQVVTA